MNANERTRPTHPNFRSRVAFEALVATGAIPADCLAVVAYVDELIIRQQRMIEGMKKERGAHKRGTAMRMAYDRSLTEGLESVATSRKILLRLCQDLDVIDFCEELHCYKCEGAAMLPAIAAMTTPAVLADAR
jgi:hypothetical protein